MKPTDADDIQKKVNNMSARYELSGQSFGEWEVLEQDKQLSKEKKKAYWVCRCSCGTIKSVSSQSLRSGKSTNCGCKRIKDLTGQRFNYLEVLKRDTSKKERLAYWICKCHGCGKIISVDSRSLQYHMQSCGCKQYDIISEKRSAHLEGQTFSYLTVLKRDESKSRGKDAYWICKCNNCACIGRIGVPWNCMRRVREEIICRLYSCYICCSLWNITF